MRNHVSTPLLKVSGRLQVSARTFLFTLLALQLGLGIAHGQCILSSGKIKGAVFNDANLNSVRDASETGVPFVQINAYNVNNQLVASALTDFAGAYTLSGLSDNANYRIEAVKGVGYEFSYFGSDAKGESRIALAPACDIHFGLFKPSEIIFNTNPDIAVTVFNRSINAGENAGANTLVSVPQKFLSSSVMKGMAKQSATGSIYGLAWNKSKQLLYSSAFVKQFSSLGPLGLGGIYAMDRNGNTQPWLNLKNTGINLGALNGTEAGDCNYGSLVGKTGLGNMDITDDDRFLLVTNLYKKSLLIIPTEGPDASNIMELNIPNPGCSNDNYAVSAVKYYNGSVYVGVTCTAETSAKKSDCSIHVYELNLLSKIFNEILTTKFAKEYWLAKPGASKIVSQWLTDIDFNNRGEMILGIADRKGHAYCAGIEPLTNQEGDILVAFKKDNIWVLENGGVVNGRSGTGVGHYEGPGQGEFFGEDYWIVAPSLHQEVSFGTIAGTRTNEVINAVFDPRYESFSGGLHRYNTDNGKLIATYEIYTRETSAFGKSSGIGDIEVLLEPVPLEIGNLVWLDENKNGIQDADEKGLAGITLRLYDATGCTKVGQPTTDANGYYIFNHNNVDLNSDGINDNLSYESKYYVVISDNRFEPVTGKLNYNGKNYNLSKSDIQSVGIPDAYDSDAKMNLSGVCAAIAKMPVVIVETGTTGQNQFIFDIGFMPEEIVVNPPPPVEKIYDLALIKTVSSLGALRVNDYIDFNIEVYNQGNADVDYFEIIDYIPAQLDFISAQNPGWSMEGNNAIYKSLQLIPAGGHQTIPIKLRLNSTQLVNNLKNVAEIAVMKDASGNLLKDKDSTPDKIRDNDAGGIVNSPTDNLLSGDGTLDEDDQDPAGLKVFDLALILTTTRSTPVRLGEDVTFQVKICNQGTESVKDIRFIDYLPSGMGLSPNDNHGWIQQNGKIYNVVSDILPSGQCATKEITVRIGEVSQGQCLTNRAEIVSYNDLNGINVSGSDIDSKADEVLGNDAGGVVGAASDDLLSGNGFNDEDDEDPAMVQIADLALRKVLRSGSVLTYLGEITYDITVFNQGCVTVKDIQIVDYIPSGFVLSDKANGWAVTANKAYYAISSTLAPGSSMTIPVILKNTGDVDYHLLNNYAEISRMSTVDGTDISQFDYDSRADDEQNNDAGGIIGTLTDDLITDHGQIDEDDQDVATVPVVDLALVKRIVSPHSLYRAGDIVDFEIDVMNQGNTPVSRVKVVDYVDANFEFLAELNSQWIAGQDKKVYYTFNGTLNPEEKETITIKLKIRSGTNGVQVPNNAEIVSIKDTENNELTDFDSHQDDALGNDTFIAGVTNDHGQKDEDDHDAVVTNPNNFDLALIKEVSKRTVEPGSDVEWTIKVINQGSMPATEIGIVDYLPKELVMKSSGWEFETTQGNNSKYKQIFSIENGKLGPEGIVPGETFIIKIITGVGPNARPGIIANGAEIYYAVNMFNEPDEDSVADEDPDNDGQIPIFDDGDDSGSAGQGSGGSEDDADIAGVLYLSIEHTDCSCLNNATEPGNGQFAVTLTLESRNDEVWHIRSVNGLYDSGSPAPPAAPVDFVTGPLGYTLTPIVFNGTTTVYSMDGIFVSAKGFDITLENQYGDKVNLGGVKCSYTKPIVLAGQNNVCVGSTVKYAVQQRPGSTYAWTLSGGGTIIGDPSNSAILVNWTGAIETTYDLSVREFNPDFCVEPLVMPVSIGKVGGSVSCVGNAQITLNANCEATVTAKQLLVGGPYDYVSYAVMIFNKDGSLVPNATVDYSHVGKPLTAKVINTCNGNSCWSTLKVEDKLPPTILCVNDTIDCTRMRSHLGPIIYDNCDPNPIKILLAEEIENTPCNTLYSKVVHRRYVAKDASGNLSKECNSDYFLKRINLDSIVFPDSMIVAHGNSILCGKYAVDSLGRPATSQTGVPTYHGAPIWPNKDNKYCDYTASFEDVLISNTNCTKKIDRIWRFVIWYCGNFNMKIYHQLIEIRDNEAPTIKCPYNKEVFTQSQSCNAIVYLAPIEAIDSCNNGVTINITYPGGYANNFKGGYITLPTGKNIIQVEAHDQCYNYSYCSFIVDVIDLTAPVAQCDKETVISLDRFGQAWMPATALDDGSYDNCHLKHMDARRMDGGAPCGLQNKEFSDTIGFCCSDIGKLVTVMFRVTDDQGNSNTCMVQVEVQDKTIPHVTCPHDLTITCDYVINRNDLSAFGQATASDNCDVTLREVDSFYINQCREGYIDRIFIAGNQFGLDVCTQRITIVNPSPFNGEDIDWPEDLDTTTCNADDLDADKLADIYRPRITEDECDLVGVNHEDEVFRFVTGTDACFKIIRKWRVINWCRFRAENGDPIIYEWTQIIKSHNKIKPRILTGCNFSRVDVTDTSCNGGNITLIATADDDCTPSADLLNRYEIDFGRDGRYEISVPGVGGTINASGFYPLGKHRIKYYFEDLCGNHQVCEADFEIVNAKLPVAYCRKGLAVGIEPMDLNGDGKLDGEFATVWAKDFDQGSYHPCKYDLTYSIGHDTSVHSVTYNCDSIGKRTVLLCVTASNGKQDCCETFIEVQDNNKVNLCGCLERPSDLTINICGQGTDPISLSSTPRFGICICDTNKVTYQDNIVSNIPGICYRIERNWTVEFLCAGANEVFNFTQNIDVTTNLQPTDIQWPSDSVVVDNCDGSIDTADIGNVPRFCDYGGNVMVMYTTVELPSVPNTRLYLRTWNVFSKCVSSQSYTFEQKILVINPVGTKIQFPPDITINDCKKSLHPDSINGYPHVLCGCDSLTFDYKDDTIYGNPEICYLVERNWTVHIQCRPEIDTSYVGIQTIIRDVNLNPADIIWPQDTFKSYTCVVNNNPNRTGIPQLIKDYCGLVTFSFTDTTLNTTCNTVKRTWKAKNACSASQVFTKVQYLVSYNQGTISLICPPNLTVNADPNTCGAIVNLAPPTVTSPCNYGVTVTNNAPQVFPVGKTNVIFTAKDSCNHTATCTTMVTVIENVPPTLKCPGDTTVDCSVNTINLNQFGTATATDNCPGVTLKDSVIRAQNICGIGTIDRYFVATDASGNRSTCKQLITVVNNDPLDSLEINWPQSPFIVDECAPFGPGFTGVPTVNAGAASCFKISITSKDTSFCVPGNCEVDRKWTVFDSCTNNTFMYVQKIIRNDTTPPNLLGLKDTTIFASDTSCSGFVTIKAFVDNCDSNSITITNNSQFGGNGAEDASGFYPAGTTEVKFTATDACCNMAMKTIKITVIDTVSPEITCKKVVKPIEDNGCAVFNANEFVVIKQDNCSPPSKIMASFDMNNFNDTIRTICCDSIKNGQFTMIVVVYFKDEAGNINFCQTLLQAIDENRICGGNLTTVVVNGLIHSRKNKSLSNVSVDMIDSKNVANSTLTDRNGFYAFNDMPTGGSYRVRPELDADYLDGVTTYDIVLIQQHILGRKLLQDPYQFIAADVNKSRTISAADISDIRKLILGITDKFRNNKSWRFADNDYQFKDKENPLRDDWPEEVLIPVLRDHTLVSFKGIKIGDVDDSQRYSSATNGISSRNNLTASLIVNEKSLRAGEIQHLTISLQDWNQLLGAQAALYINPSIASIVNVAVTKNSALTEDQLNATRMSEGILRFAWTPELKASEWILDLTVVAHRNADVLEALQIDERIMPAEAYTSGQEVASLQLRILGAPQNVETHELRLYQNIPNPFSLSTRIPFDINYDSDVTIEVFDVNSKLICQKKGFFRKGYHEVELGRNELQSRGLYYYQVRTATEHMNRRMLMID